MTFLLVWNDFIFSDVLKGTKKLECTLPDGTGRRVIQNHLNYPFSIVSFADHFYHTDWRRWADAHWTCLTRLGFRKTRHPFYLMSLSVFSKLCPLPKFPLSLLVGNIIQVLMLFKSYLMALLTRSLKVAQLTLNYPKRKYMNPKHYPLKWCHVI